ncbi:MAG: hypothetical protein EAZ55_09935 [Cytophagales bacterium]|nr:MAG: hypothetical protein EAZ55_09935 [Cytophagales bacterium]
MYTLPTYRYFAIYLLLVFTLTSCYKEYIEPNPATRTNDKILSVMKEWYLWNELMPQNVDPRAFSTPEALIEHLKYKTLDKWSYIQDEESYFQYYNAGQTYGHGFVLKYDKNNALWLAVVYPNSAAGRAGLTRGYQLLKINGRDVSSISNVSEALGAAEASVVNLLQFRDTNGVIKEISLGKDVIQINSVYHYSVQQAGTKKVGYLVFNNFIETSRTELDLAFAYFRDQAIEELILDLRYNGGGRVNIAQYLASNLAPTGSAGKTFVRYSHNPSKRFEDVEGLFLSPQYNFNLKRLICITSRATASASELVINSLKPFMPVTLIGENTYGKPVGSYGFQFEGYVFNPISLRTVNALGQGDYFDGFKVDAPQTDGLNKQLGDAQEPCLAEALFYIQNGSFTGILQRRGQTVENSKNNNLHQDSFREEVGVF